MKKLLITFSLALISIVSYAQPYATLLKGGHLIDPKNGINKVMDVAIQDGKIAAVAVNIDPKLAKQVINYGCVLKSLQSLYNLKPITT